MIAPKKEEIFWISIIINLLFRKISTIFFSWSDGNLFFNVGEDLNPNVVGVLHQVEKSFTFKLSIIYFIYIYILICLGYSRTGEEIDR